MDMWKKGRRIFPVVIAGVILGIAGGCGNTDGGEDLCEGPEVDPNLGAVSLGEMFPPSEDVEDNPGDTTRVPVEWTVLLESTCEKDLEISETCVVGEEDEGSDQTDARHFTKEGPTMTTVPTGEESAIRLTYQRENPNSEGDVDNVAVLVQSNAENRPTLVVPICARVIGEDDDPESISCTTPVEKPAEGEQLTDVCSN